MRLVRLNRDNGVMTVVMGIQKDYVCMCVCASVCVCVSKCVCVVDRCRSLATCNSPDVMGRWADDEVHRKIRQAHWWSCNGYINGSLDRVDHEMDMAREALVVRGDEGTMERECVNNDCVASTTPSTHTESLKHFNSL